MLKKGSFRPTCVPHPGLLLFSLLLPTFFLPQPQHWDSMLCSMGNAPSISPYSVCSPLAPLGFCSHPCCCWHHSFPPAPGHSTVCLWWDPFLRWWLCPTALSVKKDIWPSLHENPFINYYRGIQNRLTKSMSFPTQPLPRHKKKSLKDVL